MHGFLFIITIIVTFGSVVLGGYLAISHYEKVRNRRDEIDDYNYEQLEIQKSNESFAFMIGAIIWALTIYLVGFVIWPYIGQFLYSL